MRINFFGDFVASPSVDKLTMSQKVKILLADSDINIVNFEAPCLSESEDFKAIEKSGPNLLQDIKAPQWLYENGFHVAALSNNHILDYGDKGLDATLNCLDGKLKTVGAGIWKKAYEPLIIEKNGLKIAFLSLTHCEFGTLTDKWDTRYSRGTAWINHPDVDSIIMNVRQKVDKLFVFAHAGVEHISQPLPEWRDRYRSFIDLGCDGVIASHPHIIQGWEIYCGKPIVYSLGNFYFPKPVQQKDSWYHSICASVNIDDNDSIRLEIVPLSFKADCIDLDESLEAKRELEELNKVLADEALYMEYINKVCVDKLEQYYNLFRVGGLYRLNARLPLVAAKDMVKRLTGRGNFHPKHLINNLWCESHRYCICRALKLVNDLR